MDVPLTLLPPFNPFLGGNKFLSANLIEKIFLSLKWAEKNILLAICAFKKYCFLEKKKFCCAYKRKKIF